MVSRHNCLLLLLLSFLTGCGESEAVRRINVAGAVTYGGSPVKEGLISFEPLPSSPLITPSGYAAIVDGKYDTGEYGPASGDFTVRITAIDRSRTKNPGSEMEMIPPLFPEYITQISIPENGKLDFEVPVRKR